MTIPWHHAWLREIFPAEGSNKEGFFVMSWSRIEAQLNRFAIVGYDFAGGMEGTGDEKSSPTQTRPLWGSRDMDVRSLGNVTGGFPIRPATSTSATGNLPKSSGISIPQDQLEISNSGKMLDKLSQTSDLRSERLAQIKEAIANGTYDTDEKLEAALSRMFDAVSQDLDDEI